MKETSPKKPEKTLIKIARVIGLVGLALFIDGLFDKMQVGVEKSIRN